MADIEHIKKNIENEQQRHELVITRLKKYIEQENIIHNKNMQTLKQQKAMVTRQNKINVLCEQIQDFKTINTVICRFL